MELLANKLRPNKLSDVIGQEHLVGKNGVLSNLAKNKKIFSMILYGNPGIGKTSIAYALVNELGVRYRFLNATINKKEDFDVVIEEAKMYGEIILIVDEIHRMNKDKQDILLPHIENGSIILIGLTTANPYYKINPAIRSRCEIYELHPLENKDIKKGIKKACASLPDIKIDNDAIDLITSLSSGDYRTALNLLEVSYYSSSKHVIDLEAVKKVNSKPVMMGDKDDDGHYQLISALQKSIRGSDVDAAIYYLARLIAIGDLDIIYRRLNVIAYEDIGLANPSMGPKVRAAIDSAEMLGLPEARIPLSEVTIELALSPKSNSAICAIDSAIDLISKGSTGEVPAWIHEGSPMYKYPHSYPNHWVKQQYLPNEIKNNKFYEPCINTYENGLNKINKQMKEGK
ncbi:MAG TPA: replication-associated recombination protein A [Bacilli bacterium]|jgi:putative ATPase|nr:replication-associated recombination protein A [Bacilli bacterium]